MLLLYPNDPGIFTHGPNSSSLQVVSRLFQNIFLDLRVIGVLFHYLVRDVNGVGEALGLHVVESQLVAYRRVGLVAISPCLSVTRYARND